jgi:crotonobetainyl-CoA:carnitine CoA-transferase CaiB-like acyl-CoA transferase
VDAALEVWIGERTEAEVLEAFESVHAAATSVYDMADIAAGEQCGRGRSCARRRRQRHP